MAAIQKHSAIQGTLTTQYRSPRSPRKQLDNSSDNVKCLGCWNPNPSHHPCLFCENCLKTMKTSLNKDSTAGGTASSHYHYRHSKQHQTTLSNSDSFDSQDSDLTAFEKHGYSSGKRQLLRTPRTKELIINSSLGLYSESPIPDSEGHASQQGTPAKNNDSSKRKMALAKKKMRILLSEKAKQTEKTATRCGFCSREDKRRQLVVYCIHCKKHLCDNHSDFHATTTVFRPHATVDLVSGANKALM